VDPRTSGHGGSLAEIEPGPFFPAAKVYSEIGSVQVFVGGVEDAAVFLDNQFALTQFCYHVGKHGLNMEAMEQGWIATVIL
jgi:hypothetical protein